MGHVGEFAQLDFQERRLNFDEIADLAQLIKRWRREPGAGFTTEKPALAGKADRFWAKPGISRSVKPFRRAHPDLPIDVNQ